MSEDDFKPLGESVPATIHRMLYEAHTQADTIWYASAVNNSLNDTGESVLLGIDTGPDPDYRILVTDAVGNQTIYEDFEEAMRAVTWGNIRASIELFRDQIKAFGRAMGRVDFTTLLHNKYIVTWDDPPREPHHAHLIKQHIRSARKPAKHARNSRQIMVAAIPYRQTRRNKRKVKKMEQK